MSRETFIKWLWALTICIGFTPLVAILAAPALSQYIEQPTQEAHVAQVEPAYEYRAWLMDRGPDRYGREQHAVYDGDTLWLTVDLGFGIVYALGPCRLYGIDTPELRGEEKEQGEKVRDYVREVLDRPENKRFLIRTEQDEKGKYGRYLVTIILPDGTNLNQDLVERGFAEVNYY